MTDEERKVASALPGEIEEQFIINATWAMESAACLLWALARLEGLPAYDTQADQGLLDLLPEGPVETLAAAASLRDSEEITRARDLAELWHWRSRTRRLQEDGKFKGEVAKGLSIEDVIRLAAEEAVRRGDLAEALGGDFPIFGRPYRDATADEWGWRPRSPWRGTKPSTGSVATRRRTGGIRCRPTPDGRDRSE
jgi:hypothetical protein